MARMGSGLNWERGAFLTPEVSRLSTMVVSSGVSISTMGIGVPSGMVSTATESVVRVSPVSCANILPMLNIANRRTRVNLYVTSRVLNASAGQTVR